MTKFKIGDIVLRSPCTTRTWNAFVRKSGTRQYKVTAVNGPWLQLNGGPRDIMCAFHEDYFTLASETSDELPPAPKSVLYLNEYQWGVKANNLGDELLIGVGDLNNPDYGWKYASLDADAALQLSHDLNRMANEIKRKEKQNA